MIIKVCGMKHSDNIRDLQELPIDMMGMIFYEKSPRFVYSNSKDVDSIKKRVGVFVNTDIDDIQKKIDEYKLDFIQLHGNESAELCKSVKESKPVIKAFSIANKDDFDKTADYEGICEYFLFDTKTPDYGGSGIKFDWSILNSYQGNTPFLLSGGITSNDAEAIRTITHPLFAGIDLNSKFETSPGVKDIALLEKFIKEIRYEQD